MLNRLDHPDSLHDFFANEFACALLMPEHDIVARQAAGWAPEELAQFYDVPIAAVKWWLGRLAKHPPIARTEEGSAP